MDMQDHNANGVRIFQAGERFFMLVSGLEEIEKECAERMLRDPQQATCVLASFDRQARELAPAPPRADAAELHKEEYQTLRKEVETAMSELNTLETSAVAASALVFAWLVTHKVDDALRAGWLIPPLLVACCGLRALAIARHLRCLGHYIKYHERKHIRPRLPGWEHFLSTRRVWSRTDRRGFRGKITVGLWLLLLASTTAFGGYGMWANPSAPESKAESAAEAAADGSKPRATAQAS